MSTSERDLIWPFYTSGLWLSGLGEMPSGELVKMTEPGRRERRCRRVSRVTKGGNVEVEFEDGTRMVVRAEDVHAVDPTSGFAQAFAAEREAMTR